MVLIIGLHHLGVWHTDNPLRYMICHHIGTNMTSDILFLQWCTEKALCCNTYFIQKVCLLMFSMHTVHYMHFKYKRGCYFLSMQQKKNCHLFDCGEEIIFLIIEVVLFESYEEGLQTLTFPSPVVTRWVWNTVLAQNSGSGYWVHLAFGIA